MKRNDEMKDLCFQKNDREMGNDHENGIPLKYHGHDGDAGLYHARTR